MRQPIFSPRGRAGALFAAAHGRRIAAAMAFAGSLYALSAFGSEGTPVSAFATRVETLADRTRVVFELTEAVEATARPIVDPDRIIVDLPEVAFRIDPKEGRAPAASKLVKSYRYGQFAPGRSRIVVDLGAPAKILRAESEAAKGGARLVVDLAPTDAAKFAAAAKEAAVPAPAVTQSVAAPPPPVSDKPIVVIDPGHGGVDMGATGKHGEQEKAIVFEFARALAAKIEGGGQLHAVMTRTEDVFLPLNERVRIARANNAALFLSIHADTLAEPHVEGATVYTVSAKASDAEAARIAAKENLADQAAGLERKEDVAEVGDILFELTQRETRAYSHQFSQALIARWKDAGSLNKNPARAAGFVVLKAYDIPSVLLELGYLSSEKDLARLTSPEWRDHAAEKTAEAVAAFFAARSREARVPTPATGSVQRPQ